jgi:hypothetical protein
MINWHSTSEILNERRSDRMKFAAHLGTYWHCDKWLGLTARVEKRCIRAVCLKKKKKDKMRGTCSTHGGSEKCKHFYMET